MCIRSVGSAARFGVAMLAAFVVLGCVACRAQEADDPAKPAGANDAAADAAAASAAASKELAEEQFEAAMAAGATAPSEPPPETQAQTMNLLRLASPQVGGMFMYPIYAFSFIVVLFGIERAIGLRRRRVIPRKLYNGLQEMLVAPGTFDPRKAYRLCQKYPSATASIVRAALLKTGRPISDLEYAVNKANEREAARLYANIRPLNLTATVAPLLGLIGTVQGMIIAFYRTAYLPDGANKAQALAEGVYIALVTTFAGLCVAIPAVCLAHLFEGKIQRLFRQLDELLLDLLPVLERYEGKLRVSRSPAGARGEVDDHGKDEAKTADSPSGPASVLNVRNLP